MPTTRGAKKKEEKENPGSTNDPGPGPGQAPEQAPEQAPGQAPEQAPGQDRNAANIRLILYMKSPLPGYGVFSCIRLDEIEFLYGNPPFDLLSDPNAEDRIDVVAVNLHGVETDVCVFGRVESGIIINLKEYYKSIIRAFI